MWHSSRSIPGVATVMIASVVTLSVVWLSINSPVSVQAAPAGRSPQAGIVSTCDEPSFKNALAGGGTVTFNCSGIITLTTSALITAPTTIDGAGQSVTLSGGGAVRIITTTAGVGTLTLRHITLTRGVVNSGAYPDNSGGALFVRGNLVLSNSVVISNSATGRGGGAYVIGTLALTGTQFLSNTASWDGGGLFAVTGLGEPVRQFLQDEEVGGVEFGGPGQRLLGARLQVCVGAAGGAALHKIHF